MFSCSCGCSCETFSSFCEDGVTSTVIQPYPSRYASTHAWASELFTSTTDSVIIDLFCCNVFTVLTVSAAAILSAGILYDQLNRQNNLMVNNITALDAKYVQYPSLLSIRKYSTASLPSGTLPGESVYL